MTPTQKRNLLRWPAIILIRLPILLPFWALIRIGEFADVVGVYLAERLPGQLEIEPHYRNEGAGTLSRDNLTTTTNQEN